MVMMIKQRLKSKTHWSSMAKLAVGAIVLNLPMVQDVLGDNYGYVFIGFAILDGILRELTTKPVSEK